MAKTIEQYIKIFAGTVVFTTALLGYLHNQNWLFITMFAGLNLFQFGFTGFCPLKCALKKAGVKE